MLERALDVTFAIYFASVLALFDYLDRTGWFEKTFHRSPQPWHFAIVYILVLVIAHFLPNSLNFIISIGIICVYIGWKIGKSSK